MQHRREDTQVFSETPEASQKIVPGSVTPLARDPHRASATKTEDRNGHGRTVEDGRTPAVRNTPGSSAAWNLAKDVLLALSTFVGPFAAFLDEAVETVAGTLNAPYAEILKLTPDGFARRARFGFGHAPPSQLLAAGAGDSHAGYALSAGRTLSVRNYGIESRFHVPGYLREAGINAGITVPIRLPDGDWWGVVAVHDRPNRSFSADARAFAEEVARLVGVALVRERELEQQRADLDRKLEEERRSRRSSEWRLGYFAEAEQVAAMAETTAEAVQATVRSAVPALADWCYVDLIHEHPAAPATIARDFVEHADDRSGSDEIAEEFKRRYPVDYNAPFGTPKVLRTGEPDWIPKMTDEHLRQMARDPVRLRLFRRVNAVSFMCVPLEVGRRRVGAIGFYSTTSGRRFDEDQVEMACRLARILSLRLAGATASAARPPEQTEDPSEPNNVLSPTEIKILKRLADGKTPQQIATERKKSLSTVRNQIAGIRRSCGVNSYEEAIDIARERDWLPVEPDRK